MTIKSSIPVESRDGASIRRRRQFSSAIIVTRLTRRIERSDLRVIKRDRTHEVFDRRKRASSMAKACEKRSTGLVAFEDMVDEIIHELETSGREVTSSLIGTRVLEKLREIDEVAYLRYASVYRHFKVQSTNSWMQSTRSAAESNRMRFSGNCFLLRQ